MAYIDTGTGDLGHCVPDPVLEREWKRQRAASGNGPRRGIVSATGLGQDAGRRRSDAEIVEWWRGLVGPGVPVRDAGHAVSLLRAVGNFVKRYVDVGREEIEDVGAEAVSQAVGRFGQPKTWGELVRSVGVVARAEAAEHARTRAPRAGTAPEPAAVTAATTTPAAQKSGAMPMAKPLAPQATAQSAMPGPEHAPPGHLKPSPEEMRAFFDDARGLVKDARVFFTGGAQLFPDARIFFQGGPDARKFFRRP